MEVSGQLHALAALPRKRGPITFWIGRWVDPRADLEAVAKRNMPVPRGVKLTTNLHLVPRLKMCGAIPPFPHTSSWRGT